MSEVLSFRPWIEKLSSEYGEMHPHRVPFAKFLSELVIGLAGYQEEGNRTAPQVFLTLDLKTLLVSVKGNDPVDIGGGPLQPRTAMTLLKTCGPLGQSQEWAIYALANSHGVRYGIFRTDRFPLHESSFQRLKNFNDTAIPVIGLQKIGAYIVEMRSGSGRHHFIDPAGILERSRNPTQMINQWVSAVTSSVPPELKKKMAAFYRRIGVDLISSGHGALIAVVPKDLPFPSILADGIVLPQGTGLTEAMRRYLKDRNEASALSLAARSSLIRKMITMDGVTVFNSSGELVAYNCFVRNPDPFQAGQTVLGGARKRAFEILLSRLDQELDFTLYQSQDGFGLCRTARRIERG